MQFGIRTMLLILSWIAVSMAGFSLGGAGASILIAFFVGLAVLFGSLTYQAWPTARRNEKRVGVFATVVAFAGFLMLFFSLVMRSQVS